VETVYATILEEFSSDLAVLRQTLDIVSAAGAEPKVRVALANSSTLLLAATFEEFVRQLAIEFAKQVVRNTQSVANLPSTFIAAVWAKTFDKLARQKLSDFASQSDRDHYLNYAAAKFTSVQKFCSGDLSQDIYEGFIHNENNLRIAPLNSLFKLSGLSDICNKACDETELKQYFGNQDAGQAHGKLQTKLNSFIEKRNAISHALSADVSSSPDELRDDLKFLEAFGKDIVLALERYFL
jgi:hypothetical protein